MGPSFGLALRCDAARVALFFRCSKQAHHVRGMQKVKLGQFRTGTARDWVAFFGAFCEISGAGASTEAGGELVGGRVDESDAVSVAEPVVGGTGALAIVLVGSVGNEAGVVFCLFRPGCRSGKTASSGAVDSETGVTATTAAAGALSSGSAVGVCRRCSNARCPSLDEQPSRSWRQRRSRAVLQGQPGIDPKRACAPSSHSPVSSDAAFFVARTTAVLRGVHGASPGSG